MFNKLKPKSKFTRNVLTLMTGTTIAQAIPIAISPILTRIYSPEDFGILALYIAIVGFVSIIVTARYEMAIVLPKSDEEAINIVALSLVIMLSIVIVLFMIIILFKEDLLSILNAKSIGNFLYLIPFSVLAAGLNQIFNYWSNRKQYFKNISSSQISQSITIGASQPLLGYFHIFGGLIIGNLTGRIIGAFILIDKFVKNDKVYIQDIKREVILEQMKKYKDFPLVNSLHAFGDILKSSGSVMLISSFFGASVLGFYALSLRVLQVPVGIVGSALGQVLYQKFTIMYNNGEDLHHYVKKIVLFLFAISLVVFSFLYFIAPDLFAFVFGEKWRVAGEYSQILIPYLFMNFLISPISQLPIILDKQKTFFYFSLIGNSLFIISILLGQIYNIKVVLCLISVLMSLYYIFILYYLYNLLKKDLNVKKNKITNI